MRKQIAESLIVFFSSIAVAGMAHSATIPHRPLPYRTPPTARPSLPHIWCLHPGKTLKSALTGWAYTAGWRLQWNTRYDYPITVTTCFKGTFLQVMPGVANAYRHAERPFYLDLYPKQRLAIISD